MEFDEDDRLHTRLYDKRDDFDFPTVNFPYLSINIPESPAYIWCFVLQLIRCARVCLKYCMKTFCSGDLHCILVSKSLSQGYSSYKLQTTFRKFYFVIHTLFTNLTSVCHIYGRACSPNMTNIFSKSESWRVPYVEPEMLTLTGTPDFTAFGEFMILFSYCIYSYIQYRICQS